LRFDAGSATVVPLRCLLIHPEFRTASFWNYREACRISECRYPAPPLGLVTVAAMLPRDWTLRVVDRNVEAWSEAYLDWADVVLVGAMIAQQPDALELVAAAKARGKTVVVGGPDPTSSPHVYGRADHLVLGEAEVTLPLFLADLAAGRARHVYATEDKADITQTPCPRYDLIDLSRYLYASVQWCRGCPFSCEFCDIIEIFGRKPRAKTTAQMLAELQCLYDSGYRGHVDFVDDNFIGNKTLAKKFLPELETWLAERGFPFEFSTEATINLADDDVLLDLMQRVGFFSVFVGIESPDEETLIATQKRQNTRRSIAESVQKIYGYGIFVYAGFIVGFDSERGNVAQGLIDCIQDCAIPVSMAGLLFALPNTQLSRRLAREGRLHPESEVISQDVGDQCTAGLNFETLRPRADVLRDYLRVIETVYEPEHYFDRVARVARQLDCSKRRVRFDRKHQLWGLRVFLRIIRTFGFRRETRRPFWRVVFSTLRHNPRAMRYAMINVAIYAHLGPFARFVGSRTRAAVRASARARVRRERAVAV
jgi:hypothetical protein